MSSDKKVEANRENAKHSTGPKTEAGKNVSRFNAIKHGFYAQEIIVQDEERAEFDELRQTFLLECNPITAIARELFQRLLHAAWNLHRIRRIESEILNQAPNPFADPELRLQLDAIGRHSTRIERTYNRAIKELGIHRSESFTRGLLPEKLCEILPFVANVRHLMQNDIIGLHREQLAEQRIDTNPAALIQNLSPEELAKLPDHVIQDLLHMPDEQAKIPKS